MFSTIMTIVQASCKDRLSRYIYNYWQVAAHFDIVLTGFGCSTIGAMVTADSLSSPIMINGRVMIFNYASESIEENVAD